MVMSGLCSVVATVAIIVFGSTTMIRTIFWGSIIDHVVVTNHDVTTAQLVAGVWLVLECIHWLAISKWLPKENSRPSYDTMQWDKCVRMMREKLE